MKTFKLLAIILIVYSLIISSCEKDKTDKIVGEVVELYLIESFETTDINGHIDENSVITKTIPLLNYSDILSYDPNNFMFVISEESKSRILNLEFPVNGTPFAIKVDNEIIYTGYFWPSYSSLICNWINIDPFSIDSQNEMKVTLGYPSPMYGEGIPDKRNASQILNVFRRDNKLIE